MNAKLAQDWNKRADQLLDTTLKSIDKWSMNDKTPPYIPLKLPGSKLTFKEAMRHRTAQRAAMAPPALRRRIADGRRAAASPRQ